MSKVYVTTYEVIGDGLRIAQDFYERRKTICAELLRFAESVGGEGFRPNSLGGFRSIMFPKSPLPVGWRKIATHPNMVEAVPTKATNRGKALIARIEALPKIPLVEDLATALGYAPKEMAIDYERGTFFFPTELRVAHPANRIFVRLPRVEGDDFIPDETKLRAIPESELMKAVEDHNAEAKRLRDAEAA